jgi:hypothetical protein
MEDISLFAYFHCSHLVAQSSRIFYAYAQKLTMRENQLESYKYLIR